MSVLQILSNTINDGYDNKTNKFEMILIELIDGLNTDAYIEVLDMCYPGTTKNINDDECWFQLDLKYQKFNKEIRVLSTTPSSEVERDAGIYLNVSTQKIIFPRGIYSLKNLVKFMNNVLNPFDVYVSISDSGKIRFNINMYAEYWLLQTQTVNSPSIVNQYPTTALFAHDGGSLNKFRLSSISSKKNSDIANFVIDFDLKFSTKLAFMLGFKEKNIHLTRDSGDAQPNTFYNIYSDFLPDVSDGLDKIFVYCEELDLVNTGNTSSELLAIVPIYWSKQGNGNGELIRYSPSSSKRKFKKNKISSLHITLKDAEGKLIPFDSGTVSFDCLIHYANH